MYSFDLCQNLCYADDRDHFNPRWIMNTCRELVCNEVCNGVQKTAVPKWRDGLSTSSGEEEREDANHEWQPAQPLWETRRSVRVSYAGTNHFLPLSLSKEKHDMALPWQTPSYKLQIKILICKENCDIEPWKLSGKYALNLVKCDGWVGKVEESGLKGPGFNSQLNQEI